MVAHLFGDMFLRLRAFEEFMTLRFFLIAASAISAFLGLVMLLVPGDGLVLLGATTNVNEEAAGHIAGTALIGLAIAFWYARDAQFETMEMSPAMKGILYGGCFFNSTGVIEAAWLTLAGRLGSLGWVLAAIHLFLAVGFFYFAEGKHI
jgi:hypothetical protein